MVEKVLLRNGKIFIVSVGCIYRDEGEEVISLNTYNDNGTHKMFSKYDMIKKWSESENKNKIIKKSDAIKEARDFYSEISTIWTENEFIKDRLNALEEDGYILI